MKCAFAAVLLAMGLTASAVTVTVDRAQQRFPWNGKIDLDVTLSGTEDGTGYCPEVSLVDGGRTYVAATFETEPLLTGDGAHRITWDFGRDFPEVALTNVTVKVGVAPLADTAPLYLVFDLSAGKDAASYPHRYTTQAPDLSDDTCRTTELWMRRIPAGQFTMGYTDAATAYTQSKNWLPPHQVILTKPYYIGVFEMTQGQYYQLTGEWPSYFSNTTYRATRPVEKTSYQLIRGTSGWYDNPPTVQSSSKLYAWRTKFGFSRLDLPTEAQWEMAARGGTLMRTYDPVSLTKNLGRNHEAYSRDGVTGETAPDVGGTAKVGSYPANPWGLYDMMGNVLELVGDGNPVRNTTDETVELSDYANDPYFDPRGPTQEMVDRRSKTSKPITLTYDSATAVRGGSWYDNASSMLLHFRDQIARSIGNGTNSRTGFRLCITCD